MDVVRKKQPLSTCLYVSHLVSSAATNNVRQHSPQRPRSRSTLPFSLANTHYRRRINSDQLAALTVVPFFCGLTLGVLGHFVNILIRFTSDFGLVRQRFGSDIWCVSRYNRVSTLVSFRAYRQPKIVSPELDLKGGRSVMSATPVSPSPCSPQAISPLIPLRLAPFSLTAPNSFTSFISRRDVLQGRLIEMAGRADLEMAGRADLDI